MKNFEDSLTHSIEGFRLALEFADIARGIAMSYFRMPNGLAWKADATPVTLADTKIETDFRSLIRENFPNDGILGEETGFSGKDRNRIWVIDPIDGTESFATGSPLFGTLLALMVNGSVEFGIFDACAMGERWIARRGEGAKLNGAACRTSDITTLSHASMACPTINPIRFENRAVFDALADLTSITRLGGDCYAYGLLASGHVDLVVDSDLKPFDFLAFTAIIEEAGGIITDWEGEQLTMSSSGSVLAASTAELHEQALRIILEKSKQN